MTESLVRWIIPKQFRPARYIAELVRARTSLRVVSGPFLGLRYPDISELNPYKTKLLGIYERELHEVLRQILLKEWDVVINIGSAEGYYSVGISRYQNVKKVLSFEMDATNRALQRDMAELNQMMEKLDLKGKCEKTDLQVALASAQNPLLICDCEGNEETLLDPSSIPGLNNASILVEIHDFIRRGLGEEIQGRFESSHEIQIITQRDRNLHEFPYWTPWLKMLPRRYVHQALNECRPERMRWFWMVPKSR